MHYQHTLLLRPFSRAGTALTDYKLWTVRIEECLMVYRSLLLFDDIIIRLRIQPIGTNLGNRAWPLNSKHACGASNKIQQICTLSKIRGTASTALALTATLVAPNSNGKCQLARVAG